MPVGAPTRLKVSVVAGGGVSNALIGTFSVLNSLTVCPPIGARLGITNIENTLLAVHPLTSVTVSVSTVGELILLVTGFNTVGSTNNALGSQL